MSLAEFANVLEQVTNESRELLQVIDMSQGDALESMLEQVLEAITLKFGEMLDAERATLFLVDEEKRELFSKVAESGSGRPVEIRLPIDAGIAGNVAVSGKSLNIPDPYAEPLFDRSTDERTGFRTRSILCVPIQNAQGRVFAVAELLNKQGGKPFESSDERRLVELASSLGVILETWWRMSASRRASFAQP